MSLEIRGLTCASCKKDIPADGVTCTGCSAPHHWPCYSSAGHCASCQSAKPPMPFGVAVRAPARTSWAVTAGVLAALLLASASLGLVWHATQKQAPGMAQLPMIPPPPPPPIPPAFVPPPPPPPPAYLPPPPPPPISGARRRMPENTKMISWAIGARTGNARATTHPGRLQGFLNDAVLSKADEKLEMCLDADMRSLFLNVEVRANGMPGPLAFKVAVAKKAAKMEWADAGTFRVPPTGRRWYRLDAAQPFDAVRLSLEGSGASLAFASFCALLERPKGEVLDATRYANVKSLEGGDVVLAGESGATLKLPASLLPTRASDGIAFASPNGNAILRLTKDGNVGVFDGRNAQVRSFGTHLLSLHTSRNDSGDETDAWIDGIGVWSLLERWRPSAVKDAVFSAALETTAVLNEDGTVALYRPSTTAPSQSEFESVDELAAVAGSAGASPEDHPYSPERHRITMKLQQLGFNPHKRTELTRSQLELMRFLREDAAPRFRKLVPAPRALAVGDRVGLGWRSHHFGNGFTHTLQVTMLDKDAVMMRPMERTIWQRVTEIEVPRAFLPALPAPRVGQYLYLDWDAAR